MAATRAKIRATGELLEDQNNNPSNLQKELQKINQKNKNKKVESARQGRALEQTPNVEKEVDELPFVHVDVQPLPVVARSQTKKNDSVPDKDTVEKLF